MDSKRKSPAKLKDIAIATGYSINTISRALRDKDDISEATKEKIKEVAAKMGHIGNTLASSLRLGYTNTIAVILGDVSNPHFAIMMKEIEGYAREYGYTSFLINTNEDEELEFQAIQTALNKNVDGIIICPTQKTDKNIKWLKNLEIPFVLIGRYFNEIDTDYVVCNDELGGYQATKKLLDSGHKKILMLNGPSYISSSRERLKGYKRAYKEAGIKVDKNLIKEVPVVVEIDKNLLLKNIDKNSFTAIFAFSDFLAWKSWGELHNDNFNIPQDYSLIGFDHIHSRFPLPFSLATISSYKKKMSISAVDLLLKKIKDKEFNKCEHIIINTKLIEGETIKNI